MNVSDERLQRLVNAYLQLGDELKVAQQEDIKPASVERLLREAKIRGMTGESDVKDEKSQKPNVLVFDIETSPVMFWGWEAGKQYIGSHQILTDWYVFSWAAKWLCEADVFSACVTSEESIMNDDRRVIEEVWKFLDYADVIIAHNAWGFDVRKLNTRFIYYNMPPPSPYQVVDTLKAFQRQALFSSNKQDYLALQLGLTRKVKHEGWEMWIKCWNGEQEALDNMLYYNKGDIMGLEELYMRIRPYIKSHPNMNLFVEGNGNSCPNCGSSHIKWMDKFYHTSVNKYSTFRCLDCNAIGRSPSSSLDKTTKPKLISVAR